MLSNGYKKVVLKVIDSDKNLMSWVHFCYVPRQLWEHFKRVTGIDDSEFGAWLAKWAKEDFDIVVRMSKKEDIETLRKAVTIAYQDKYFELFSPSLQGANMPTHSLLRNWVSIKMKVECAKYEQS